LLSLYAVAFALLAASGVVIAFAGRGLLASTRLLWASTILSGLAIVIAVCSVLLPRR